MTDMNVITVGEMIEANEKYGITFEIENGAAKAIIESVDLEKLNSLTLEELSYLNERFGISYGISKGIIQAIEIEYEQPEIEEEIMER